MCFDYYVLMPGHAFGDVRMNVLQTETSLNVPLMAVEAWCGWEFPITLKPE